MIDSNTTLEEALAILPDPDGEPSPEDKAYLDRLEEHLDNIGNEVVSKQLDEIQNKMNIEELRQQFEHTVMATKGKNGMMCDLKRNADGTYRSACEASAWWAYQIAHEQMQPRIQAADNLIECLTIQMFGEKSPFSPGEK